MLVIAFDDRTKAQEFLLSTVRLQKQKDLQVHDAVFVDRDTEGHTRVTETTDITPGKAALGAGVWGLLLGTLFAGPFGLAIGAATAGGGALFAKLRDVGIKDEKVEELRREVPPGRTASGPAGQRRFGGRPSARIGPFPERIAGRIDAAAGGHHRRAVRPVRGQP